MKKLIFAAILTCLALNVRAQQQQQIDSTPVVSPWVRANTPSHSGVGIALMSPDTCWGACADSGLLISTDGGLNWRVRPGEPFNGSEFFRTKQEGWLLSGPSSQLISKTTDAGGTWQTQTSPISHLGYLTFVDSLHVFITGGAGQISRTTDGGGSWSTTNLPVGVGDIGFANSMVGYAVGPEQQGPSPSQIGAACVKTVDGGNTWNQIYTGIPGDADGIAIIDPQTVVVVGDELIYRTTNGGTSWTKIPWNNPTPGQSALLGIDINNGFGYITGAGYTSGYYPGIILRTSDTGKSWTNEPSGVNAFLYDPVMYDDSIAACADDSGIILIRNIGTSNVSSSNADSLSVTVFPNPSQLSVTLSYVLPSPQIVTLSIYDVDGNTVGVPLSNQPQNIGSQLVSINTKTFPSGTYFFRFSSQNYSSSGSFIVTQ